MKYKLIIGGIIAFILLFLYSGIVIYIVTRVFACSGDPDCKEIVLKSGMLNVLTIIGGLVSALVISKLSVTTPGADPALISYFGDETPGLVKAIIWAYLFFWTFIGLLALVVGVLIFPETCKTLSQFGTTWLGTAVAAGWAYFGLDPKGTSQTSGRQSAKS